LHEGIEVHKAMKPEAEAQQDAHPARHSVGAAGGMANRNHGIPLAGPRLKVMGGKRLCAKAVRPASILEGF